MELNLTFQDHVAELGASQHASVFEDYLGSLQRRMKLILMICDHGCQMCPEEGLELVRVNLEDSVLALQDLVALKKALEKVKDMNRDQFKRNMLYGKLLGQLKQFRLDLSELQRVYGTGSPG